MAELPPSSENEPLVVLITVVGLPGCGKSSFCKALLSHITTLQRSSDLPHPFDSASWHYICFDSVEAELRDSKCDFDPVVWKASREKVVELVSGLSNFSDNAETTTRDCPNHRVILLDDNMYYRSMRKKWYRFARERHCMYRQILLSAPMEVCLARNESRPASSRVPDFALRHMAEVFEWPREDSGSWELQDAITTFIDSHESSTAEQVDAFIKRCNEPGFWSALPQEFGLDSHGSEVQSDAHVCDVALRRIVSQALAHVPKDRGALKSSFAKRWGSQKTDLLKQFSADVKAGDCNIPVEDLIHDVESGFLKSCITDIQKESL